MAAVPKFSSMQTETTRREPPAKPPASRLPSPLSRWHRMTACSRQAVAHALRLLSDWLAEDPEYDAAVAARDRMDTLLARVGTVELADEDPKLVAMAERAAVVADERKKRDSDESRAELAKSLARLD